MFSAKLNIKEVGNLTYHQYSVLLTELNTQEQLRYKNLLIISRAGRSDPDVFETVLNSYGSM